MKSGKNKCLGNGTVMNDGNLGLLWLDVFAKAKTRKVTQDLEVCESVAKGVGVIPLDMNDTGSCQFGICL